jgi:hypothetical protein
MGDGDWDGIYAQRSGYGDGAIHFTSYPCEVCGSAGTDCCIMHKPPTRMDSNKWLHSRCVDQFVKTPVGAEFLRLPIKVWDYKIGKIVDWRTKEPDDD